MGFWNGSREVERSGRPSVSAGIDASNARPLEWIETPGVPLSHRVEKMKLSKDKTALAVNPSLTLAGIPPETFRCGLGKRSALEWVRSITHPQASRKRAA
jgi:hypothetical protein